MTLEIKNNENSTGILGIFGTSENGTKAKVNDICVYCETDKRMIGRTEGISSSNIEVDLSGFDPSKTYYVTYDESGGNEQIAGRMDKISRPQNWYNYQKKIWANVVTVNGNNVTYWTYIPRYEYLTITDNTIAQFIPVTKTEPDGGYKIPESFTFGGKELKGYWISKYEVQQSVSSGIEQIQAQIDKQGNVNITTTDPNGQYTIYVNGEKKYEHIELPQKIEGLNGTYDITLYSETNKRMIGTVEEGIGVIEVDLSGFNPNNTYYVTYDETGNNEQIGEKIQLDKDGNPTNMPNNWYNYSKKIWANIVTQNNGLITYWTYIPRYEYLTITDNTIAQFIPVTKTEPDGGYKIPESFTFGGKQLKGYWISKYEVQGTIE